MKEMIDKGSEFALIRELTSRRESCVHYVFRCSPNIRKRLMDKGDFLYTQYSRCNVYDRYYVYQCFKCQKFGHRSQSCKSNFEVCAKCSGRHKFENCTQTDKPCCANCKGEGKLGAELEHWASSRDCPQMAAEILKVTKLTDHGF